MTPSQYDPTDPKTVTWAQSEREGSGHWFYRVLRTQGDEPPEHVVRVGPFNTYGDCLGALTKDFGKLAVEILDGET